jgi:hypothetical protein
MRSSIWVPLRKRNITSIKRKHSMKCKMIVINFTQQDAWSRFWLRNKRQGWILNRSHSATAWLLINLFIESTWREIQEWNYAELGARIQALQQQPKLHHLRSKTEEISSLKDFTIATEKTFLEIKQSFQTKNWLPARTSYPKLNFASDWTSLKRTQMREMLTKYQVYMLKNK